MHSYCYEKNFGNNNNHTYHEKCDNNSVCNFCQENFQSFDAISYIHEKCLVEQFRYASSLNLHFLNEDNCLLFLDFFENSKKFGNSIEFFQNFEKIFNSISLRTTLDPSQILSTQHTQESKIYLIN